MPALSAVLDTNVLLSGIAYPGSVPGKLIAAWKHGALEMALSAYILNELRRVLITGDKALLTLRDRYPICTPAEFWAAHGGL
jgi:predicted nucleic acid-binding protein